MAKSLSLFALRNTSQRTMAILCFLAVYIGWGSTYLAIRMGLESIPPYLLGSMRHLIAGAILYILARGTGVDRPEARHWKSASIVGALLLLGGNGCVILAERRVPSGVTSLLVAMVPLYMVLFTWFLGHNQRLGAKGTIGLFLGIAGLALLVEPWKSLNGIALDRVPLRECLMLLFGSACWAAGSLYSRDAARPNSGILFAGMQMLAGGIFMGLAATAHGEFHGFHFRAISVPSTLGILYLILIGSCVSYTAYIWLMKHCPPSQVATYAYVNPVVAVFMGWTFAGELVSGKTLIASAVIIAAVALIISTNVSWRKKK